MTPPLLLDLSHTSHTRARTGIQRVTRSLWSALGNRAVAITHDPHRRGWRELDATERQNLLATEAAGKRGARWSWRAKLRGRAHRILQRTETLPAHSGLLMPEVFSPAVARTLPDLFARVRGPRVALFHDAIALQYPELTPPGTVARFPSYLVELLAFDGIAAVSDDSRESLLAYWRWLGVKSHPPVVTIALGISRSPPPPATSPAIAAMPAVLCLASIEGRKNHLALLDACESLWARGVPFKLHLIGLAHPRTGAAALARIRELQSRGRPLAYDGPVSDERVDAAYATCSFSVYPSLKEGFGLPVLESLVHGKPCICSARGALGESARGGGCLALETADAPSLAAAIARLLHTPAEIEKLTVQARRRRFKTWPEYADEIVAWIDSLRPALARES